MIWGREAASLLAHVKPPLELEVFSLNTLYFQLTQPSIRVQSLESGVPRVGWTPASTGCFVWDSNCIAQSATPGETFPPLLNPDLREALIPEPGRHYPDPDGPGLSWRNGPTLGNSGLMWRRGSVPEFLSKGQPEPCLQGPNLSTSVTVFSLTI